MFTEYFILNVISTVHHFNLLVMYIHAPPHSSQDNKDDKLLASAQHRDTVDWIVVE